MRLSPFFAARLKIMGIYFVAAVTIFVVTGWVLGFNARQSFYQDVLPQDNTEVQERITLLEERLLRDRFLMFILFGVLAYFITDLTLRPIRKSAELQKNFVAIVSHELRTPVTIMKNAAEVALRNTSSLSNEKAIALIKDNLDETNRLAGTIEFLLTFSSLQSKIKNIDTEKIVLEQLIEKTIRRVGEMPSTTNVQIKLVTDGQQPCIQGNHTALEGMFVNLLRNAIAYSPKNKEVRISVFAQGKDVRIAVHNEGKSISKDDLPYIFEPFYRGKNINETNETFKGIGIGLSIVKAVVELHKGTIVAISSAKEGTTFTVKLPLAKRA